MKGHKGQHKSKLQVQHGSTWYNPEDHQTKTAALAHVAPLHLNRKTYENPEQRMPWLPCQVVGHGWTSADTGPIFTRTGDLFLGNAVSRGSHWVCQSTRVYSSLCSLSDLSFERIQQIQQIQQTILRRSSLLLMVSASDTSNLKSHLIRSCTL